jgi:hypothetical protein
MNATSQRRRGFFSVGLVASPAVTCPAGRSRKRRVPTHRIEIVGRRGLVSCDTKGDPLVDELRKYRYAQEGDADYRHRMLVNFLATIVIIFLMVTGSWMTIISSWSR